MPIPRVRQFIPALLTLILDVTTSSTHATAPGAVAAPHAQDVQRCHETLRRDPAATIALAQTLLGAGDLRAADELVTLGCLGYAKALAGDPKGAADAAARMQRLLDAHHIAAADATRALTTVGGIYQTIGQTQRAAALFEQAYKQASAEHSPDAELMALQAIAGLHFGALHDPATAARYQQQAIEIARKTSRESSTLYFNHGMTLVALARYDEANAALDRAVELADQSGDDQGLKYRADTQRATILLTRHRPDAARPLLEASIAAQQRIHDRNGEALSRIKLGNLQLATGELDAAQASAQQALKLGEDGHFVPEQQDALKLLIAIHTRLGQPAQALAFAQRAHALELDQLKNQNLQALAALQAQLQDEANARRLDVQTLRIQRAYLIIGALLVVVGGVGVFTWLQRRSNRRLRRLSARDPLTGLLNRREAMHRLNAMQAMGGGVLLLVDADGFKAINDAYGHGVGDQVLLALVERLKRTCRSEDIVARWGGEEFLIASQHRSLEWARALAERLRLAAREPIRLADGTTLHASISIGFAPFPFFADAPGTPWQDAARLADRALYAAKHAGRDAWVGLWGAAANTAGALHDIAADPPGAAASGFIQIVASKAPVWHDAVAAEPARGAQIWQTYCGGSNPASAS